MKKQFLYGLLLLFFGGNFQLLFAQYPSPKVRVYDENIGFQTTNYISDVKVDRAGLVWIVDFSGISTYDGKQISNINTSTVSHGSLLRLYEQKNGKKFVIDFLGKIFFIQADSLVEYSNNDKIERLKPRSGYSDLFIDEKNRLHISYYKLGYVIIDSNKVEYPFHNKFPGRKGEFFQLQKDGEPFVFSHNGKNSEKRSRHFYLLNKTGEIVDSAKANMNQFRNPSSWSKISEGNYLGCNGRGDLFRISNNKVSLVDSQDAITNVISDSYGGIWVSTSSNGLNYYESEKLNSIKYQLFNGETATASAIDHEGGIWLYSPDRGLLHIPYPRFLYYNESNGLLLNNHVFGIEKKAEKLLVSSDRGTLSTIDTKSNRLDSIIIPAAEDKAVYNVHYDPYQGNLWASLRGELFFLNDSSNQWSKLELKGFDEANSGDIVRLLGYSDAANAILAVLNNQFFLIRGESIDYVSPTYPDNIYQVEFYNDSIFVGAEDGLYIQHEDKISYLGENNPQLRDRIYSITRINNSLYFSIKNKGVFEWNRDSFHLLKYQNNSLHKGAVFKRSDKQLIIISKEGTFLLEKNGNRTNWTAFERPPKIIAGNFILRDSVIYWGTWKDGVYITSLKDLFHDSLRPAELNIQQLKIDGEQESTSTKNLQVPYNKGLIEFHYSAYSYQSWELSYRYRLLGLSDLWTVTDERKVQYTTLPAGDYEFQLQVKKGDQFWSPTETFHFTVNPPFWKRWWFILTSLLLIALIIYLIISYRIRQIKREKDLVIDRLEAEQRALRAQMDPHFVFNIVSSAQYLVMKEENEKAIHFLNKFSQLMRNILDYSNTNYISLKEELDFLKDYTELEQIRLEDSFQASWEIDETIDKEQVFVPPFMIQPFLENAVHHGLKNKEGERSLSLSIQMKGKFLHIVVEDNGIGRENAAKFISKAKRIRKSHGLRIITERLKLHNASSNNIEIEDVSSKSENKGTRVSIRLKITKNESINS